MSREIRRVPKNFDWPIGQVWGGYIKPEKFNFPACPDCSTDPPENMFGVRFIMGDGYSPEARAIAQTFYPHQIDGANAKELAWHDKLGQAEVDYLLKEGRLRTWDATTSEWVSKPLTADEVNERERTEMMGSHDGINRNMLIRYRCKRLGIEMFCKTCQGYGSIATTADRTESNKWKGTNPPKGKYYQVWETVSEGSPISPVLDYLGLIEWLREPHPEDSHFATGMSLRAAKRFIDATWVPSMISSEKGLQTGIEFLEP